MTKREKIRKAAQISDVVASSWNDAQQALNTLWVNGAGVLDDPSMARSDLYRAKDAIEKALAAMRDFSEWPRAADYD
jgi:hypothetical protein